MFARLRAWLTRLSARPQSRVLALVVLAAIVLFAGWWGVALAIAYTTVGLHFAGLGHVGTVDLIFLLVSPVLVPIMLAGLATSSLAVSLAWQVIRSWRASNRPAALPSETVLVAQPGSE